MNESLAVNPTSDAANTIRQFCSSFCRYAIELITICMIMISPWLLGAAEPGGELLLHLGVAVLLLLWAIRMLIEGSLKIRVCSTSIGLAALLSLGLVQVIPIPASVLHWISPESQHLNTTLLPEYREEFVNQELIPPVPFPAGHSISVYPAATRKVCVQLLSILVFFLVVRNNIIVPGAYYRLSIAAVCNGTLLGLFALMQLFSSPQGFIYWTVPVLGVPYGPFVCKNHFPFYVNICIGLSLGLLLSQRSNLNRARGSIYSFEAITSILHHPAKLWILIGLSIMVTSCAFSLSRGGVISLSVGTAVCFLLTLKRSTTLGRLQGGVVLGAIIWILFAWFGIEAVKLRLSSLWTGAALQDIRLPLWYDGMVIGCRFPLLGSGFGTYLPLELTYRTRFDQTASLAAEHVHNDYIEGWAEGGIIRVLISIWLIYSVFSIGFRRVREFENTSIQGFLIGLLVAFTTIVVHSVFDFGLQIPAIAAITTALLAYISGDTSNKLSISATPSFSFLQLGKLAVVLPVFLLIGGLLIFEAARSAHAYALEVESRQMTLSAETDILDNYLTLLEQASKFAPDQADIHLRAGQAYLDVYELKLAELRKRILLSDAVNIMILSGTNQFQAIPIASLIQSTSGERKLWGNQEYNDLVVNNLLPGLKHFIQARDLCPLIAKTHMRIAASIGWFSVADPQESYIERGKQTFPTSAEIWYLAGILELKAGRQKDAWTSWNSSLRLSQEYLDPILTQAGQQLGIDELLEYVIPADPSLLLSIVEKRYSDMESPNRDTILLRALALYDNPQRQLVTSDYFLIAKLQQQTRQDNLAITSYAAALTRDPTNMTARLEYAKLLYKANQLKDALAEVQIVLANQPKNVSALELRQRITRAIAEGN